MTLSSGIVLLAGGLAAPLRTTDLANPPPTPQSARNPKDISSPGNYRPTADERHTQCLPGIISRKLRRNERINSVRLQLVNKPSALVQWPPGPPLERAGRRFSFAGTKY